MYICIYTNKECNHADKSGECKHGCQNCGWENWKYIDDVEDDEIYNEEEC